MNERTILTPAQVAKMFGVDARTAVRWAKSGKVPHLRTPGGHFRFYEDEILEVQRKLESSAT